MKKMKWLPLVLILLVLSVVGALSLPYFSRSIAFYLNGDKVLIHEAGTPFTDPGFVSEMPDQVRVKGNVNIHESSDYILEYELKNGLFKKTLTRVVQVRDTLAPEVNLTGDELIILTVGSEYIEPGINAFDQADGDLSESLEIHSNLDVNQIGRYEIEYRAKDKAGHESVVKRYIWVTGDNADTIIYLTFDDGPSDYTPQVLDILNQYDMKATFFVIFTSHRYDEHMKRAYDEGHQIALHTYTHQYKRIYANKNAFMDDLYKVQDYVNEVLGIRPMIFRFAGGSSTTYLNRNVRRAIIDQTRQDGFVYFDWNVESKDSRRYKSDKIVEEVISNIKTGKENTILFHDGASNEQTVLALPQILDYIQLQGYTVKVIDENTTPIQHRK